jgi:hypothetical protein
MPIIKVTKADILKTRNVTPGWYSCQVVKVHPPTKSKEGNTINYVFDCRILDGQECAGKEIPARFNSFVIGNLVPFVFACTGIEMDENNDFDTDKLLGAKFDGKVVPKNFEGNIYDNFEAYIPYGAGKDQVAPF